MKLSYIIKRYLVLAVSSFMLISLFQNCGQPGSIAVSADQKLTDLDDGTPGPPPPPPGNPAYRNYDKNLTVNPATTKVDVLVVVDNSGSMSVEQSNMGMRFASFLGKLQGLDWQVGIVTTDVQTNNTAAFKDGRLLRFNRLNKNLINSTDDIATAQLAFQETVQRPNGEGSGNEQGVKATFRALERAASSADANNGLIRSGAALSVILVSDADETVAGNGSAGDPNTFGDKNKTENLQAYIATNYPGKTFKFNSIIVRDGDVACLNLAGSGNEGYGRNYQKLTNATSGVLGSVCEADYGNQLSVIGDNTVENVRTVALDCNPVDSDGVGGVNLVVTSGAANTVVPASSYTLSGRIVTFAQPLAVGSYKFSYTCLVQ